MANNEAQTETTEAEVQTTEQAQPETTVEPVQLTIQDLQALASIVDLASKRGAFQTQEFTTVGTVFNKLTNFLEYVKAQAEANAEATGEQENTAASTDAE